VINGFKGSVNNAHLRVNPIYIIILPPTGSFMNGVYRHRTDVCSCTQTIVITSGRNDDAAAAPAVAATGRSAAAAADVIRRSSWQLRRRAQVLRRQGSGLCREHAQERHRKN
jgi:hypothetical protein